MKKTSNIKFKFLTLLALAMIGFNNAYAKAIGPGLTDLNNTIKRDIGLACVILAITISGLYIAFGKKEGQEKLGSAVTGALVIAFAGSIGALIWNAAK